MEENIRYMRRCIQLARCGWQKSRPNPMVGAVIVEDGKIIGEGYHIQCGKAHAEVNAVAALRKLCITELINEGLSSPSEEEITSRMRKHASGSTIYVSLEPCSHFGKTPPCADLLAGLGFRKCVIGCIDSFAKVSGRGIERLKAAGIEVEVGVLERECRELNRKFFTFHTLKRPYVTLKWAETSDGFIDYKRASADEEPLRISTSGSIMRVHKLRAEHMAIIVGSNTARLDHPSLKTREWAGDDPLRIVIDRDGSLSRDKSILKDRKATLFCLDSCLCPQPQVMEDGTEFVGLDFKDLVPSLMKELHSRNIQSLLVEGGARLLQSFIDLDVFDEIQIEKGGNSLDGDGVNAPVLPMGLAFKEQSIWNARILTHMSDRL